MDRVREGEEEEVFSGAAITAADTDMVVFLTKGQLENYRFNMVANINFRLLLRDLLCVRVMFGRPRVGG